MSKTEQFCIGQLNEINREALIPYSFNLPLLFSYEQNLLTEAVNLCEALSLQLLSHFGVSQAKILLYEANPSRNFSYIKKLFAKTNRQWGEQIFNQRDFSKLVTDLNEKTHKRFALFAGSQADDIFSYNKNNKNSKPIIFLLIHGISLNHDDIFLENIKNLCTEGAPAGVIPILLRNTEKDSHSREDIRFKARHKFWDFIQDFALGFELNQEKIKPLKQSSELWRLFYKFKLEVKISKLQYGNWTESLIKKTKDEIESDPRKNFLHIPIGMEGSSVVYFSLGERSDAYHALFGGATRTGKTTLLNNIILNACETFTPDKLQFDLFDFKEGVSFHVYQGLEHINTLHIDNDKEEEVLEAFKGYTREIKRRIQLFRETEHLVTTLPKYNELAEKPLPRLVIVIDEAQSLFENRNTKIAARKMLQTVSRKGAALGLHLILCTQSYQNVDLDNDVKEQFRLRIGLQLANSMACRALMGKDNDAMLQLQRFSAVVNNNFGENQDNHIVILNDLPDNELIIRLNKLKSRFPKIEEKYTLSEDINKIENEPTDSMFADWTVEGEFL